MNRAALFVVLVGGLVSGCAATQQSEPPSPSVVAPSPIATERLTVAGSSLEFTAHRPEGWDSFTFGLQRGSSHPPKGIAFVASLVDNTFSDPCAHVEREPKVGPTVDDLIAALGEIPNTTANEPVDTTLAGYTATSIELQIPASLPCTLNQFILWQDSPGNDWWAQGANDRMRIWVLEVGGERVAIAAHMYPDTSEQAKAELEEVLDSIEFDAT